MFTRILTLCSLLLLSLAAQAVTDIFMKVEGIKGDATNEFHLNEIVLDSYTFSFALPPGAPSARGAGGVHPTITPFVVTKVVDSSSPNLALRSLNGLPVGRVDIAVVNESGFEFLHFILSDVVVCGFAEEGLSTALPKPRESIQLSFSTIEIAFNKQLTDGSPGPTTKFKWDVTKNKEVPPTG